MRADTATDMGSNVGTRSLLTGAIMAWCVRAEAALCAATMRSETPSVLGSWNMVSAPRARWTYLAGLTGTRAILDLALTHPVLGQIFVDASVVDCAYAGAPRDNWWGLVRREQAKHIRYPGSGL